MIDAVVAGTGLAALQAALDLAEVGLRVAVVEHAEPGEVAGGASGEDAAAEPSPEPDHEGAVATLIERIAEGLPGAAGGARPELRARAVPPVAPLLRGRSGAWCRQPEPEVWGIPAVPLAAETIAALGSAGALRAYLDRFTPLLTVGKTRSLGTLVRKRLGATALGTLVGPQLRERYGVPAEEVEVAIAAPGLNEALTRTGSLSAAALAYSERHAGRETSIVPEAGWGELRSTLIERLGLYGVEFPASPIADATRRDDGGWELGLDDGSALRARAAVVDLSSGTAGTAFDAFLEQVLPRRFRMHAAIGIEAPEGLSVGEVALRGAGDWSLRLEPRESPREGEGGSPDGGEGGTAPAGAWRARLSSPRLEAGAAELGADPRPLLYELLAQAGVRARPEATWSIAVRAGAHCTAEERERESAALRVLSEAEPELLAIGRALHGDDLSAALDSAHRGAVELRRWLLGIAA